MSDFILAIDQGTTSSRAIVYTVERGNITPLASAQMEFAQHFPKSGWVEHDPQDIWQTTLDTCREAIKKAGVTAGGIAGIGITNQRETTIVWDRESGEPVYNAIVWQDRRTADVCAQLRQAGAEKSITEKTGLLLDPYFSGTKIAWILDHVEGARQRAEKGELLFGTVDCFVLWRLTGGKVHATDATNASRTMLYNINIGKWDEELLEMLNVPAAMLPRVMDSAAAFGVTETSLFGGEIAICGIAGDQQAATVGQACFEPGMMKATYGTGCFAILNTGSEIVHSSNRLLTTIAYQLDGKPTYALEGSIFIAGAAVQWLRDGLGIIDDAAQTGALAEAADDEQNVYLVPAFTGLGAPYWDAECRGAIYGLTRATGPNELARAALEAVCYQTRDLIEAMRADWQSPHQTTLRVDGGMVASDWTMQCLANMINAEVDRPEILETTALGAACLAGLQAGIIPDLESLARNWQLQRTFKPEMPGKERRRKYAGWRDAVSRTLSRE
ncbi:Glycerol kinase [hydrothermal vent metagenome]|uniref:glycerol kinase n=1 Tax=hydrothermal vent metagenome TaxID=652676 RepID=A0A3B0S1P2_9ZZZZ